jgi:hypothetical protein
VLAELLDEAGEQKATGQGFSDPNGNATVRFFNFGGPGVDPVIRPGDRLRLARVGGAAIESIVPPLGATIDTTADRITGEAPAGAEVHLALSVDDAGDLSRSAMADDEGRWALSLAGELDLPPGGVSGSIWVDVGSSRFSSAIAAFRADLVLGAAELRGLSSAGAQVSAEVGGPGGPTLQAGPTEAIGQPAWTISLGGDDFGPGPRPGPGPAPSPRLLSAGDTVTLTLREPGAESATTVHTATLPALSASLDPAAEVVRGSAPAGASVRVRIDRLGLNLTERDVVADENGAFQVDFSDTADLGPGWRAQVWLSVTPELRAGAVAVVPLVRLGVGTQVIHGLADPRTPLTITLRAPDGTPKVQRTVLPGADGSFGMQTAGFFDPSGGDGVEIMAGDRVEVAIVAGDPWVATVPELSAAPDVLAGEVAGTAPPGATVRLTRATGPGGSETVTARADGMWRAALPELEAPASGSVSVGLSGPFEAYSSWSATALAVTLGEGFVFGNGPRGRRVSGELRASDGRVIARAEERVFDPTGSDVIIVRIGGGGGEDGFVLDFRDLAGQPVPIEPGDQVFVRAGDAETTMTVPPLEGVAFIERDAVAGRSAPDAKITLRLRPAAGGSGVTAETTADGTGAFTHDFDDAADLRHNDELQLSTYASDARIGHQVIAFAAVPGLSLDLDRSLLAGTVTANTKLDVALRRDGRLLSRAAVTTGGDGLFDLALTDGAGRPFALQQGDALIVSPLDPSGPPLQLDVPELTIEVAPGSGTVSGRATPGGSLAVLATAGVRRDLADALAQAWPQIAPNGRWAADFVPRRPVQPGRAYSALYRLPAGHAVTRERYVPLLGLEHGGATACGVAGAGDGVEVEAQTPEGATAAGRGRTRPDGRYGFALTGVDGAPVALGAGTTATADLGGTAAALTLPALALRVDWASGRISGSGPSDTLYQWLYPARRCYDAGDAFVELTIAQGGFSGEQGAIGGFVLPFMAPGEGMTLELPDESGHRIYRDLWRALAEVHVGAARITGSAGNGSAITATLRAANGQLRATAATTADLLDGSYALTFRETDAGGGGEPDGPLVLIEPGDRIELGASLGSAATGNGAGDDPAPLAVEAIALTAEPLSFDWAAGQPVEGVAPPNRPLTILLRLRDGRVLRVPRWSDADGRFTLAPTEVPPRADWAWGDVAAVRVRLDRPDGHAMVAQSEGFEPGGPAPDDGRTIYLPIARTAGGPGTSGNDVEGPTARQPVDSEVTIEAEDALQSALLRQRHQGRIRQIHRQVLVLIHERFHMSE